MKLNISAGFRQMAIRAVLNIFLFIIVYLLLVLMATALMALCLWAGLALILLRPSFITIVVGLGIAVMGIFVMIFLIKFIFKKHVSDRSHLIEVTSETQPELYKQIESIVQEVKTDFPKRIYLSSDVNAAVFYDSGFWSMFFPIRKNLMIGMGLVNTVTVEELRAILAHEFGHFSQRSMKIGSYDYNVNKVIYNMLFENDSYSNAIHRWASYSNYFAFFIKIGIKIIQAIQWVLGKMYALVNLSHSKLSREMEFHADQVAAHYSGSEPLAKSLLRLDLADHSYKTVVNYYQEKIGAGLSTQSIYKQQAFVMNFVARQNDLDFEDGLPQLKRGSFSRFNSRLVITDQWASHPNTNDRVKQLQALNIPNLRPDARPAISIFFEPEELERRLTAILFAETQLETEITFQSAEQFRDEFSSASQETSFPDTYNGFYDHRQPVYAETEYVPASHDLIRNGVSQLFSHSWVEELYTCSSMEEDLATIIQIRDGNYDINSFDYDGKKYMRADWNDLVTDLGLKLTDMKEKIRRHDILIYSFFTASAQAAQQQGEYTKMWNAYLHADKETDTRFSLYKKMTEAVHFIHEQTSFEEIDRKLKKLSELETEFRTAINSFLNESFYKEALNPEIIKNLSAYAERELNYFVINEYDNQNLRILFTAMNDFQAVISKSFHLNKKALLEFQSGLINETQVKVA